MSPFPRAAARAYPQSWQTYVRDLPPHIEAPASDELRGRDQSGRGPDV